MSYEFWKRVIGKWWREIVIVILGLCLFLNSPPKREKYPHLSPIYPSTIKIEKEYVPVELRHKETTVYLKEIDTVQDTVFVVIKDTLKAIKEFVKERVYVDTLKYDDTAKIILTDIVRFNAIQRRSLFMWIQPITIKKKSFKRLYFGVGVGGWNNKFGISGNLMYIADNKKAFSVGYNPIQKYINLTLYWGLK